jgi:hypothetical protein
MKICYPSCTLQGSRQRYQFWNISTVPTQSVSPEACCDKYPVVANCTPDGMWWCLRRKQQWPMRRHYFGISREVMRKVATVHLYLFICSFFYYVLFNDAFSVTKTNYVASNEMEITQWWIGKEAVVAKIKVLFGRSPGGTEENYENLNQDNPSPGLYLNPGPPECEAWVLTT